MHFVEHATCGGLDICRGSLQDCLIVLTFSGNMHSSIWHPARVSRPAGSGEICIADFTLESTMPDSVLVLCHVVSRIAAAST